MTSMIKTALIALSVAAGSSAHADILDGLTAKLPVGWLKSALQTPAAVNS